MQRFQESIKPMLQDSSSLEYKDQFIQPNSTGMTLSQHFASLLGKQYDAPSDWEPYEFYFLFLNKKTDEQINKELTEWNQTCIDTIKKSNKEFVINELAIELKNGTN